MAENGKNTNLATPIVDDATKQTTTATRSPDGAAVRNGQATKTARVLRDSALQRPPAQLNPRRFGPRRTDVTHWRCKRIDPSGKGAPLFWGDDDVEESEWPIESLSLDAVRERWGAGRYVAEYYGTNEAGARVQRGKSAVIHLREPEVIDHEALAPAPRAAPVPVAAGIPAFPGGATDFNTVFSLLAFLEDRNEKARLAAATEAKISIDRSTAEAKLAHDRYRADLEFQLQRERLASQERIAQIEAMHRGTMRQQQQPPPLDHNALIEKLGNVVAEKVEEALEDFDPGDYGGGNSGGTSQIVTALRDTLMPILGAVASNMTKPPTPTLPGAPEGNGNEGGQA